MRFDSNCFLNCTLESVSYVNDTVIYETMYRYIQIAINRVAHPHCHNTHKTALQMLAVRL